MPPVRHIGDLANGLNIDMSDGSSFDLGTVEIDGRLAGVSGNIRKKETKFNEWLQVQPAFANVIPLTSLPPDDRALEDPPQLLPYEYIEDGNYIGIKMYIAVHIFEASPLRFAVKCKNKQSGPITGDWWE